MKSSQDTKVGGTELDLCIPRCKYGAKKLGLLWDQLAGNKSIISNLSFPVQHLR